MSQIHPYQILLESFSIVEDPRRKQAQRHSLKNLLFILLVSSAMGVDSLEDVIQCVQLRQEWFAQWITFDDIPSESTLRRILAAINPEQFLNLLLHLLEKLGLKDIEGRQIAIDGKITRGISNSLFLNAYDPHEKCTLVSIPLSFIQMKPLYFRKFLVI